MFQVNVTVEGDVIVDRVLQGIESRAQDMRPVWPKVLQVFQAIVARAFASEGTSTGAPWQPLAPSTEADRRRKGFAPAHPILERTGTLKRALTIGEGAHLSSQPTSMTYRLSAEIRNFWPHQSNQPRRRLPRRAPVLLTGDDRNALVQPIRLWITGRDINAAPRGRIG